MTAVLTGLPVLVQESIDRFVAFLERGETGGVFAPDAFADLTFPQWRVQAEGRAELIAARARTHPQPGTVRIEKVLAGPSSYALKVEERWDDGGQRWYCREGFVCEIDEQARITEISLYCTGDWDEATVARHAEAVTLLRP